MTKRASTVPSPQPEHDDRALAEQLLRGEEFAVARIRQWVRRATARYRRFVTNDLDDLEQEILLSLMKTLEGSSFRYESRLETYVSRMAHYRCIDLMRAGSQREWVEIDGLDLVAERTDARSHLEEKQSLLDSLRIAASLPSTCRELWSMIHDGLSYQQMAKKTGVAPGTLRVRVLRCRRKALELRERQQATNKVTSGVTPSHLERQSVQGLDQGS